MWTAKTLIRLGGRPGWSESSLGAHAILLVLSCCGWNCLLFQGVSSCILNFFGIMACILGMIFVIAFGIANCKKLKASEERDYTNTGGFCSYTHEHRHKLYNSRGGSSVNTLHAAVNLFQFLCVFKIFRWTRIYKRVFHFKTVKCCTLELRYGYNAGHTPAGLDCDPARHRPAWLFSSFSTTTLPSKPKPIRPCVPTA